MQVYMLTTPNILDLDYIFAYGPAGNDSLGNWSKVLMRSKEKINQLLTSSMVDY